MTKYLVVIDETAAQDIETAFDWYEAKALALEERFEEEVELCLKKISLYPENYTIHKGTNSIRKIRLKNFPYNIFYFIKGAKITILAVIHKSRSDEYIHRRLT